MVISKRLSDVVDTGGLLARVLEVTTDAVVIIDRQSTILVFNHGAEQIFGYVADEVINKNLSVLLPERVKDHHDRFVHRFDDQHPIDGEPVKMDVAITDPSCDYRESYSGECTRIHGVRKNGEEFPIDATITKLIFKGQKFFTAIIRDVSERENHLSQIREQEKELRKYRKTVKRELLAEVQIIAQKRIEGPRA